MAAVAAYETATIYRLGEMNGRIQCNHMIFPRFLQAMATVWKANFGERPTIPPSRWLDTRAGVYITVSMEASLIYGSPVMRAWRQAQLISISLLIMAIVRCLVGRSARFALSSL
jgi:hypothetical protein